MQEEVAGDWAGDIGRDQIMHPVNHFNESEFYPRGSELKGFKEMLTGIVF